jgi:hypothetical protein
MGPSPCIFDRSTSVRSLGTQDSGSVGFFVCGLASVTSVRVFFFLENSGTRREMWAHKSPEEEMLARSPRSSRRV